MKRVLVVALLLGVMLGLRALKAESSVGHDPLTLAAIGFVLLASFSVAELGVRVGLPRVTGYIVSGVVLGPSVANILSWPVVGDMKVFNTLALGLIATNAGLELDIGQLKRLYKTHAVTTAFKIVTGLVLVGGAFYVYQTAFGPLPLEGFGVIGLALVFAALSVGTSPSISIAVINDTKAKGRLAELVLGAAVVKDLVVIILLAVAIAVARPLLTPGAELEGAILVHVAIELGSSVLAGAALGALLIAYVRFVHQEMLLFVAAVVLVVSELGRALHLELLLVFIVAGFVVRNFSKHEHDLLHPLEMVALPVFVVFFTIAGANVDFAATLTVLPLAATLVTARAIGYFISARVAGRITNEPPAIVKLAWLGYLPQAGVTLGLVGLAAAQLSEVGTIIATLGMAVIAFNLLIGPVTLRYALGTFEAGSVKAIPDATAAPGSSRVPPEPVRDRLGKIVAGLEAKPLRRIVRNTEGGLRELVERFVEESFDPWARGERAGLATLGNAEDAHAAQTSLRAWIAARREHEAKLQFERCRVLKDRLMLLIRGLATEQRVALEEGARKVGRGDPFGVRWRKRGAAWRRFISRGKAGHERVVPVRLSARIALEPRISELACATADAWVRLELSILADVRHAASRDLTWDEARLSAQQRLDAFRDQLLADALHQFDQALTEWSAVLARVDGPWLPVTELRYASVQKEVEAKIEELATRPAEWASVLGAQLAQVEIAQRVSSLEVEAKAALEEHVRSPTERAISETVSAFAIARTGLESAREALSDTTTPLDPVRVDAIEERFLKEVEGAAEKRFEQAVVDFRGSSSSHVAAQRIRESVAALPTEGLLPAEGCQPDKLDDPKSLRVLAIDVHAIAREELVYELLPAAEEGVRMAAHTLSEGAMALRESIGVARYSVDVHRNVEKRGDDELAALLEGMTRAQKRLDEAETAVLEGLESCDRIAGAPLEEALQKVRHRLAGRVVTGGRTGLAHLLSRRWQAVRPRVRPMTDWIRRVNTSLWDLLKSDLSVGLQRRISGRALDSAEIRDAVRGLTEEPRTPTDYARLFLIEPVRERRFFIAHRAELEAVLDAERRWHAGEPGSLLLSGPHGAGKSSLLNVAEFEMRAKRVVRLLLAGQTPSRTRLVDELALELGCRRSVEAVRRTLSQERTTVIIDDLETFFPPTLAGLAAVQDFLDLVVETRSSTFWLLSIGESCLAAYDEALRFRQAFAKTIHLGHLDVGALREVIESRHRLSGRAIAYPSTLVGRVLSRLRSGLDASVYYRILTRLTEGNLALALAVWGRSADIDETGTVRLRLPNPLMLQMTFVAGLGAAEQSLLVTLLRWGRRSPDELAQLAALPSGTTKQALSYLSATGLIVRIAGDQQRLCVTPSLVVPLTSALAQMGIR